MSKHCITVAALLGALVTPFANGQEPSSCPVADRDSAPVRLATTIHLDLDDEASRRIVDQAVSLWQPRAGYALHENLAHELGHVLGLGDAATSRGCHLRIMSPIHEARDKNLAGRSVHPEECLAVSYHWLTWDERELEERKALAAAERTGATLASAHLTSPQHDGCLSYEGDERRFALSESEAREESTGSTDPRRSSERSRR